jgi:hypothetical protein
MMQRSSVRARARSNHCVFRFEEVKRSDRSSRRPIGQTELAGHVGHLEPEHAMRAFELALFSETVLRGLTMGRGAYGPSFVVDSWTRSRWDIHMRYRRDRPKHACGSWRARYAIFPRRGRRTHDPIRKVPPSTMCRGDPVPTRS